MTVCQYRIVRDIIPGFPNMVFIIQLNVGGEVCMKLCKSQTKHFHSVLKRIVRYAATAKSLQSCPTLCDAIDGSPPGSPVPGILQARTLEWVAISFSNSWKWRVKGKSLSRGRLLATPWTAAYQAPPSMGFSRQEYWSGVPSPSLTYIYTHKQSQNNPTKIK